MRVCCPNGCAGQAPFFRELGCGLVERITARPARFDGESESALERRAAAAHKVNDQEDDCERDQDVDESGRDMHGEPKDKPQDQKDEEQKYEPQVTQHVRILSP